MNKWQRQACINKTGKDPLAPKLALPKPTIFNLIETRTNQILITGSIKLCNWKKKMHKAANPTAKYRREAVN